MQRIGKYQIQRLVARGGMGALYLARDPDLDREVAVKVMSGDIMSDEEARTRFYREAKAAARLQHRNIVTVYDFAHDGDTPYYVMELLRGQNLAERLRSGPPLALTTKLDLAIQLCEGLHFAHGEGIVHRDVKPANIWLLEDGGVKLLDFGIAKSSAATLTRGSSVVGSAAYMSPEQIEGQPVDARCDIFSLGAVLFELIADQPAFDGPSVTAVMLKITQDEPAPDLRSIAPGTPAALAAVVGRALAKSPDDRYGDASEMAVDLRAVRVEIAEHEEADHDEYVETLADAAPADDAPTGSGQTVWQTPSHPAPWDEGPPDVLPLLPPGPSATAEATVDPEYDLVLRSPEDAAPRQALPIEKAKPSGKRRWPLAAGAAIAIAASFAILFVARPEFLFGNDRQPQLRVTSVPARANILVNGVNTGLQTPADVPLDRVPADVRLELDGYQPFATRVTEQLAGAANYSINATLELQPPPPAPQEAPLVPPPPPPRPFGELTVLRPPGIYAFCRALIGRGWSGQPFDGVTVIRLPAQRYSIRIECDGQPPVQGAIQVPPGKNERNFNEVVTLEPQSDSPPQP